MPEEVHVPREKRKFVEQYKDHPVLGKIGEELEKHKDSPAVQELFELEKHPLGQKYPRTVQTAALIMHRILTDSDAPEHVKHLAAMHLAWDIKDIIRSFEERGKTKKLGPKEQAKMVAIENFMRIFGGPLVVSARMDSVGIPKKYREKPWKRRDIARKRRDIRLIDHEYASPWGIHAERYIENAKKLVEMTGKRDISWETIFQHKKARIEELKQDPATKEEFTGYLAGTFYLPPEEKLPVSVDEVVKSLLKGSTLRKHFERVRKLKLE